MRETVIVESMPAQKPDAPPWISRRRLRIAVSCCCWLYLAAVLAIWLFIRIEGDRWWPATMILFGPRWIMLLPLLLLVPLAILLNRRWLGGLAAIALLIAGPIMDFRITEKGLFPPARGPSTLRVLTFNTHFTYTDAGQLKQLIDQTKPDIVALQEWFPGNRKIFADDPTWHTVELDEAIIATHYPTRAVGMSLGQKDSSAGVTYHYRIMFPSQTITFYSVHLDSPHNAFRAVLHRARSGPAHLTGNSNERRREANILHGETDGDSILAGDFNLPRDSTIYRGALSGFSDAFSDAGLGYGWTYYSPWTAVRIDHILVGRNWRCTHCWVGPDVGSPHRPVIADIRRTMD